MVTMQLKGLYHTFRKRKDGSRVYYYYAWKGGPLIWKGPNKPAHATADMIKAYQAAHAEAKPNAEGFVAGLVTAYRSSPEWNKLSTASRRDYNRYLDAIFDRFGTMPVEALNDRGIRRHFIKFRDSYSHAPRSADYAIAVLKRLLSFAKDRSQIDFNRAEGIARLHSVDKSDAIWTPQDIENVCSAAPEHVAQAIRLASLCGLRLGDLMALKWSDIKNGEIVVVTSKGRGRRTARIPLLLETEELLSTIPRRAVQVLTTSHGKPWKSGLGQAITKAANAKGVMRGAHDLRRTFVTRLAAAGVSDEVIAGIMGWSRETVAHLRRIYVSQQAVVQDLRERIERKGV